MAQVLKYQGGGNAPKPIKVGDNYYTATQLKSDLYGDKLDEYIKFKDFNPQQEAEFRKNLDAQVDALISGRLSLQGNTLVDSQGEWKNTGRYEKPKFLGSLNEEQKANNASLDVANYLVRALNSGRVSQYIVPKEYNTNNSKLFKGFDDYFDSDSWRKSELSNKYSKLSELFDEEISRLQNDKAYRDSYSYEGWQNTEWDRRADATIKKLSSASAILKDTNLSDDDKQFKLAKLGFNLSDYLSTEKEDKKEEKEVTEGATEGPEFEIVPKGLFDFTAPKFKYKGKEYTYGTDEANKILGQTFKGKDGNPITIAAYLEQLRQNANQVDRSHIDFATAPTAFKYFSNVTNNFINGSAKGAKDIRAAYILRKDPLDPTGSIIQVVYKGGDDSDRGNVGYYRYDQGKLIPVGVNTDNGDVYDLQGATPVSLSALDSIQAKSNAEDQGEYTTDLIFRGGDYNVENLDKFIENKDYVEQLNSNKLRLRSYINSLRKALQKTADTDKRKAGVTTDAVGNKVYYIDIFGTNDKRPLRIYFKSKEYRDQALKDNDFDATRVRAVHLPEVVSTVSNYAVSPTGLYSVNPEKEYYKFPTLNKEGGILFAQMGVQLDDSPVKVSEVKVKPEKKSKKLNGREMTLSSTNNYNKELEAGVDFDSGDARRLAYSLIDLGSAVASLIPGASLASTAVGVGMTGATAIEDFSDAFKGKMSLGEAAWNTASSLGLDAMSIVPGLKAAKIGKDLKFVLKAIPRFLGYVQACNMISTESAAAIGKTMGKISSGNFDQLTTQDFNNITHAIRIATMIGRDAKGTYRKGRNMLGKKTEQVEISGKVNGQEIKTTVNKEDITTSKFKIKRIDQDKVKQKLAEEANRREDITKKPLVQEKDAEGKLLTNEDGSPKMKQPLFEVGDVKSTNTSTIRDHNLYESEVGHPKKLFEGWFGYKGYNSPISDAYIAQRWDPILRLNGQTTNKQARKIAQENAKLPVSAELKQKVDQMVAKKMISRKQVDEILEGGPSRKQFIEQEAQKAGVTPAEYVRDSHNRDIEGFTQQQNKFVSEQSSKKIEELNRREQAIQESIARSQEKKKERHIGNATKKESARAIREQRRLDHQEINAKKRLAEQQKQEKSQRRKELRELREYAEGVLGKSKNKSLKAKLDKLSPQKRAAVIRNAHNTANSQGSTNYDKNFLAALRWNFNPSNPKHLAEGGRLDIGLQLIKAYKSGGYLIPKFWNGGDVNDITYTGKPFLEDVPNYTVFPGIDLNKYFYGKNTPAQNSVNTLYKDHQDLLNNGTTVNGKTYGQAEEAYKKSINTGEFINNIEKYLQTHTWEEFNNAITELRGYRKRINNLTYGQERTGNPEEQKKLQDLIRKFNTGYIEVLGPIGGDTRVDKKQFHLNGGATLERHIALLTSQQFADKRNFKDKDGNEVYLDNAFFLNPGTYPTNPQTEPKTGSAGGADSLDTSDGTPKQGEGTPDAADSKKDTTASLVDQLDGSVQYITDLPKKNTRINTPRMLALLEAFTGIKANNDATDELLKTRSVSEDPIYRLRFRYGNYPAISQAQLTNAKINTLASTPVTSDLGTYLATKQSAYAKMAPNSFAAAQANYEADLKSRLAIQEAEEANTASQITTANANRNRAINMENYKNWLRSQRISSNANVIKTFLSETRNYMNENDKLMKGLQYEKEAEAAYRNYTSSVQKMQDDLVNLIVNSNAVERTDASGNTKTDSQILQEYFSKNPDDRAKFTTRKQDLESKYREALRKAMESKKINLGLWDTDVTSYTYKQGGTVNEKIKVQKIKDANAARRQDSKESIKAITKDKEEFGKNYRTMSAGALKLLDRATK